MTETMTTLEAMLGGWLYVLIWLGLMIGVVVGATVGSPIEHGDPSRGWD